MAKLIPFILLSLFSISALAQNYRCVQPGVKRYFTNSDHYLRAVRVDSVKTVGADTVFRMFKTPRGPFSATMNNNGGSWLGKTITIKPDGTHLIPTTWGDTVVIKSQAILNESWIIYDDTSSYVYEAIVSSIDTATILGSFDSIKTITIIAKYQNTINNSDSLHNGEIRISKNNGIVKSCDLYMFPLHVPGKVFKKGFDFYTDVAGSFFFNMVHYPSLTSQLSNKDTMQKYSFNVGDAFLRYIPDNYFTHFLYDSIIQINNNGLQTTLNCIRIKETWDYPSNNVAATTVKQELLGLTDMFKVSDSIEFVSPDTTLLPEELGQNFLLKYNPLDSLNCMVSPSYLYYPSYLLNNMKNAYGKFKLGVGLVEYGLNTAFSYGSSREDLLYNRKNNLACGSMFGVTLHVNQKEKPIFSIHPNPAHEQITIRFNSQQKYKLTIINSMGQILKTIETDKQELTIPVADLPNGVYYMTIRNVAGEISNEKIIVQH